MWYIDKGDKLSPLLAYSVLTRPSEGSLFTLLLQQPLHKCENRLCWTWISWRAQSVSVLTPFLNQYCLVFLLYRPPPLPTPTHTNQARMKLLGLGMVVAALSALGMMMVKKKKQSHPPRRMSRCRALTKWENYVWAEEIVTNLMPKFLAAYVNVSPWASGECQLVRTTKNVIDLLHVLISSILKEILCISRTSVKSYLYVYFWYESSFEYYNTRWNS